MRSARYLGRRMADQNVTRKLAAILAADVAGYSRLMGEDAGGTLVALRQLRRELLEPLVSNHRGVVIKRMGDGWLIEFGSVVDAVTCAIEIQKGLAENEIIQLRIGVHLGDIVHEDEDIYGDGINIAARLQEMAAPRGVVISDAVRRSVDSKLSAGFTDLGAQKLKNIAEPVAAYGWGASASAPTAAAQKALQPPSTKLSIAVLPFNNLSDDPEQEYFSDGMTEDLITDLSKISNLSVAARNSSFAFKGQMPDFSEVGEKLGVAFVLEGSVRKMGERLRINAQLINTKEGDHLWAERYDGNLAEIFEFQDRITAEIVSALELTLTPSDLAHSKRKRTTSVEAYDLYLKGRMHYFRYSSNDNLKARKQFERAIALDPNFAEAHSYLSCCYTNAWLFMWPGFDEGLIGGLEWANKGVDLDSDSAIAHTRLAWVYLFLREHDKSISTFEKALSLDPENAEVRAYFAESLNFCGDPNAAIKHLEVAFRLDPFCPPSFLFMLGHAKFLLRRDDEAISLIQQSIERLPDFLVARLFLACLCAETDRGSEAAEQVKAVLKTAPHYTLRQADRVYPYRNDTDRNRFLDGLREAGLPE